MSISTATAGRIAHPSACPQRPFTPRPPAGAYKLPHDVANRLTSALAGCRNREAALALAVFLGRFWSSRKRMTRPFPIDRRAIADRADLGRTEARVRGAIKTLEAIGYLNRGIEPAGSLYKPTPDGLHRKPVLWGFGGEYGPSFAAANARTERARARRGTKLGMLTVYSPKYKPVIGDVVLMGEVRRAAGKKRVAEPL